MVPGTPVGGERISAMPPKPEEVCRLEAICAKINTPSMTAQAQALSGAVEDAIEAFVFRNKTKVTEEINRFAALREKLPGYGLREAFTEFHTLQVKNHSDQNRRNQMRSFLLQSSEKALDSLLSLMDAPGSFGESGADIINVIDAQIQLVGTVRERLVEAKKAAEDFLGEHKAEMQGVMKDLIKQNDNAIKTTFEQIGDGLLTAWSQLDKERADRLTTLEEELRILRAKERAYAEANVPPTHHSKYSKVLKKITEIESLIETTDSAVQDRARAKFGEIRAHVRQREEVLQPNSKRRCLRRWRAALTC